VLSDETGGCIVVDKSFTFMGDKAPDIPDEKLNEIEVDR
jgi:hypothetical protein